MDPTVGAGGGSRDSTSTGFPTSRDCQDPKSWRSCVFWIGETSGRLYRKLTPEEKGEEPEKGKDSDDLDADDVTKDAVPLLGGLSVGAAALIRLDPEATPFGTLAFRLETSSGLEPQPEPGAGFDVYDLYP